MSQKLYSKVWARNLHLIIIKWTGTLLQDFFFNKSRYLLNMILIDFYFRELIIKKEIVIGNDPLPECQQLLADFLVDFLVSYSET